jgi:MFS family permease
MVALFITFCLPETLARPEPPKEMVNTEKVAKDGTISLSRVSTRQSVKKKSVKTVQYLKRSLWDPITVLAYLRFPPVALTVYYAAITFGGLYVLNVSLQQTFSSAPYNFSTLIVGLMYIPNSLGYIVSSIVGGRWSDSIMIREAKAAGRYDEDGNLIFLPEDRMRENAYIAAVMYPLALILYGWAAKYGLHWMVAATGGFFFGVGSMIIFSVATTMLTEFMPKKSSSGVAINNFVRNIFSCVGGIVTAPLIDSIGNGWLFTILGLWALASGFVVYAMRKFGPRWRADMQANMQ